MKKRILPEWNTYRRVVLHPESPPNQVSDIRNAFYAGCVAMFRMITKVSDRLSENKATRALEEITRELQAYGAHAQQGAAEAAARSKPPSLKSITSRSDVRPVFAGAIEIDEWALEQWHPTPDGTGPPEQLHLTLKLKGIDDMTLALRFKSRRAWDELTAIGDGHADQIWPDGDK